MINFSFIRRIFIKEINTVFSWISVGYEPLTRHCAIRRSLLYVPGNDSYKVEKAFRLKLDCIVLDCEDGVASNKKEEARNTIRKFLDDGPVSHSDPEWSVRVNPVQKQDLFEADIDVLLSAKHLPASICLPKVDTVDHLQLFSERIWNKLINRAENDRGPLKLIMFIESAVAVMTLPELCKKAMDLSTMAPFIPVALVLGSDDLLASLGATRTLTGVELFYARQKLVLVAKAFGLQAIDAVFINYKDTERFRIECKEGALMGYSGKQVIHPTQVPIAQEEFVPSRTKIKWARDIISNFKKYQQEGKGAFTFENSMIDMPTVRQAENILKVAEAAGKLKDI